MGTDFNQSFKRSIKTYVVSESEALQVQGDATKLLLVDYSVQNTSVSSLLLQNTDTFGTFTVIK